MLSMVDFDWKKFFLLAVPVVSMVAILLIFLPRWQVEQVRGHLGKHAGEYRLSTLEAEHRRTLLQSIGGFFLAVGLYVAWRRVKATEENVRVAEKNLGVAQENLGVAQEGQVTERFTRAIGQLGDDKMAIRLGGIYALERLAKDSEKDHGSIMEILTAYVRENAPRNGEYAKKVAAKPPTDIQAILTVIGRRETTGKNRRNDRLDLRHTHLAWVVILDADLQGVDLQGADLNRTILVRANLTGANLGWDLPNRTKLIVADLSGVDLTGANLSGADLSDTTLIGADLTDTLLSDAKNLTAEQVQSAKNWRATHLPDSLKYLLTEPLVPPV